MGLILGSRTSPVVGNGNPVHTSCLENSMNRRTWWAVNPWVHSESTEHMVYSTEQALQTFLDSWWFMLWLYWLYDSMRIASIKKKLYLNFDLFPELAVCDMILCYNAGSEQWATVASSQPGDHIGKERMYLQPVCTRQPFCFSLLVEYSVTYMR